MKFGITYMSVQLFHCQRWRLQSLAFESSLWWRWHSEDSQMVWHLKIREQVQKLEILKVLRKKVKIFFDMEYKWTAEKEQKSWRVCILFCFAISAILDPFFQNGRFYFLFKCWFTTKIRLKNVFLLLYLWK